MKPAYVAVLIDGAGEPMVHVDMGRARSPVFLPSADDLRVALSDAAGWVRWLRPPDPGKSDE